MTNPKQLLLPFNIDKKSSLRKFIIPNGSEALLDALAQRRGDDILISGKQGYGKSHLLQSMCNDHSSASFSTAYIPLKEAVNFDPMILEGLESLGLVCIDDLDEISSYQEWQIACFNLINRCSETGCRLILSCIEGEENFFPDLLSRLKKMTNYKLHSIEDAQLASALKAAALNLRIPIEDREINFLLKTQSRDFLLLTKFLKKIDSYSMESKRKITIPLIKEVI